MSQRCQKSPYIAVWKNKFLEGLYVWFPTFDFSDLPNACYIILVNTEENPQEHFSLLATTALHPHELQLLVAGNNDIMVGCKILPKMCLKSQLYLL